MDNIVWVLLKEDGDGNLIDFEAVVSSLDKALEYCKKYLEKYPPTFTSLPEKKEFTYRRGAVYSRETGEYGLSDFYYEMGYWYSYNQNSDQKYFHTVFVTQMCTVDDMRIP